jgi:HlyD family secretion protein
MHHDRLALLLTEDSISRDAVDVALNARDQAKAQVALDQATIRQREAALHGAQVNLSYTRIVSPVDGTVVSRNVTIGQTVAASFQTPTLFLIAQDLTKMQVDTNVSESDIEGEGRSVKVGDPATFTVEAFPNHPYHGVVSLVRQAPQTVQNVVTYDVVVAVDNPQLKLRPAAAAPRSRATTPTPAPTASSAARSTSAATPTSAQFPARPRLPPFSSTAARSTPRRISR